MTYLLTARRPWVALAVLTLIAATPAQAKLSAEELAKLTQNPLGNLVSLPFQNNTYLHVGPERGTENVLNIQPVIPFKVGPHWNIMTRTVVPVIALPELTPVQHSVSGIGDTVFTAWLSPAKPDGWIWGAGPAVQLPTHSDSALGNANWGLGPSLVLVHLDRKSPWVFGIMVNNIWSLDDDRHGGAYNRGVIQPGVNYNFKTGFYLTSSPIITVDWRADASDRWTVPVGGGIGKVFHLGPLPINTQVSAYYHVATPHYGPDWEIRAQVQLLFPK
jgi:hypothetical protein